MLSGSDSSFFIPYKKIPKDPAQKNLQYRKNTFMISKNDTE